MAGLEQIAQVRSALDQFPGFWTKLESCLADLGFDETYVGAVGRCAENSRAYKYIKDSVWGMMEFSPDEMALIDTPLVQRLRRIKQTGFTYLTYPTANHDRFSHTLGVTYVVKRFISSLVQACERSVSFRAGDLEYKYFDLSRDPHSYLRRVLTHAALLHDIGHCAFSHAGENAFKANVDRTTVGGVALESFMDVFSDAGFKSDLSECLSITIALSPIFAKFYEKIAVNGEPQKRLAEICCLIGGVAPAAGLAGIANIISGQAIDADKIDYISRDARACSIPIGVDITRIFLNSTLVDLTEQQASAINERWKRSGNSGSLQLTDGAHFVVNSAGIDTYNEVNVARSALYQRVYLHQFTRSAEQLYSWGLGQCARRKKIDVLDHFKMGDEEALLWMKESAAGKVVGARLTDRRLPKRALYLFREACGTFYPLSMLINPGPESAPAIESAAATMAQFGPWRLWEAIAPKADETQKRINQAAIVSALRTDAISARRLLEPSYIPNPSLDEPYVGFALRVILSGAKEVLVRQKSSLEKSTQWTRSEELSAAENLGRASDYVYADTEWLTAVRAACVKNFYNPPTHLAEEEGFPLPLAISKTAKIDIRFIPRILLDLEAISSRVGFDMRDLTTALYSLSEKGYFGNAHRAVPLKSEELRRSADIAKRYQAFSGESGWHVSAATTIAFLQQFPAHLRQEVANLLEAGVMLNRQETTPALEKIVSELGNEVGGGVGICRFSRNSGQFVGMIFEQDAKSRLAMVGHTFLSGQTDLDDAIKSRSIKAIAFIDDQFSSGSQASAQLLQWAGVPRDEWPESMRSEQNISTDPISPSLQEWLRSKPTVLAFVFGTDDGKASIETTAQANGFTHLTSRFGKPLPSPKANLSHQLKQFLEDVGCSVLAHARGTGWGDLDVVAQTNIRKDALGYSGACSVVVTPTNAPSHMITAFWCPGVHNGEPWVPLFLRRGYLKNLVVC